MLFDLSINTHCTSTRKPAHVFEYGLFDICSCRPLLFEDMLKCTLQCHVAYCNFAYDVLFIFAYRMLYIYIYIYMVCGIIWYAINIPVGDEIVVAFYPN